MVALLRQRDCRNSVVTSSKILHILVKLLASFL